MPLGGVIGNGSRVGYSVTSPPSYTRVGQLKDIKKFLALVANDVDTTVMGATNNIMTVAPGMIPSPTFSFTLMADLDPATSPTHEFLRNYHAASGQSTAGTAIYFGIEVVVNRAQSIFRKWEFFGYVAGFSPSVSVSGLTTIDIDVKFQSGYSVYPPGAATII